MPLNVDVSWCFDMNLCSFWQRVLRKSQEAVRLAMQKCGSLALLEVILGPDCMSVTHVKCYAMGVLEEQTLARIGVAKTCLQLRVKTVNFRSSMQVQNGPTW